LKPWVRDVRFGKAGLFILSCRVAAENFPLFLLDVVEIEDVRSKIEEGPGREFCP
jgi:hypothetical protein